MQRSACTVVLVCSLGWHGVVRTQELLRTGLAFSETVARSAPDGEQAGQMQRDEGRSLARPPPCQKREPPVAELVQAAWSRAGLLTADDRSRRRRLGVSGWLPKLWGGLSMDVGDRWDYRYEPGEPRVDQLHQDDGLRWDVGLSWDLSRTAFQKEELQLAREVVKRAAERRDLAVEVVRLAYARRRLMLKGLPPEGSSQGAQLKETTAILDAWTGGRFSGLWCGRRP